MGCRDASQLQEFLEDEIALPLAQLRFTWLQGPTQSGIEHLAFRYASRIAALITSAASARVTAGRAANMVERASAVAPLVIVLKYQEVSLAKFSEYGSLPAKNPRSDV